MMYALVYDISLWIYRWTASFGIHASSSFSFLYQDILNHIQTVSYFILVLGLQGAPVKSQQHFLITMVDNPSSVASPPSLLIVAT